MRREKKERRNKYVFTSSHPSGRLKGSSLILAQEEEDNDELKMDEEIKCAPWQTTRA